MKKPINEIAKLKRLAGLITESEYQEEVTNEYHQEAINIEKVKEVLEPHVYERMYNLSSISAQQKMIEAAEVLMNDLTEEGFEVPEIREFFTQLIANDI